MLAQTFVALAVVASTASAAAVAPRGIIVERASNLTSSAVGFHFPAARAWSDATDSKGPCGGMPLGNRAKFPVTGGQISLLNRRDGDDLTISIAKVADPTNNNQFSPVVANDLVPDLVTRGHYCFDADLAAAGLAVGDLATLQLVYKAGVDDTTLYQCADIEVVDAATFELPHGSYCINGHVDGETVDLESYADGSSGLSAGAKGGIGAGVSIAGLLLLGFGYWFYKRRSHQSAVARAEADNATIAASSMAERKA